MTGCFDKQIREFDVRKPISQTSTLSGHRGPVLCLGSTGHYVFSASDDKTVCVWDRRTLKRLQKVTVSFWGAERCAVGSCCNSSGPYSIFITVSSSFSWMYLAQFHHHMAPLRSRYFNCNRGREANWQCQRL